MNAYLFVYDRDSVSDFVALHNGIKNDTNIGTWWHYLNSAYILMSNSSADQLSDSIRTYFPSGTYLVIKITRSNYQGYLSKEAWDWIRENVPYT